MVSLWIKRVVCLALILVLSGCSRQDLSVLDAKDVGWQALRGQWVVINYWAEWCKPCIEEVPELNQLAAHYSKQVAVLGVNYDAVTEDALRQQARRLQIEFPVLDVDPASMLKLARPEVLPTTFVFSPQGELVGSLVGPQSALGLASIMGLPALL
jgi:thiol-disulfide isomerase/thioredoxin